MTRESVRFEAVCACPPCDIGRQHEYDDDYPFDNDWTRNYVQSIGVGSTLGDPCVWCVHSKCEGCPPRRGANPRLWLHASAAWITPRGRKP